MTVLKRSTSFGDMMRSWRERRRFSQLALALDADVSQRHISFMESGRARPSRDMVIRLSEFLEIPLRDRNTLLMAAGHAPFYDELPLEDPGLQGAREALDLVLQGHDPYPAIVVDRHWTMVGANQAAQFLSGGVAAYLLEGPVNALRLTLHPEGLAPRIVNLAAWKQHCLVRLRRQFELTGDSVIEGLLAELTAYPPDVESENRIINDPVNGAVLLPLTLRSEVGDLSFFGTTTVFGSAVEITLSELTLEAFYPADGKTKQYLRDLEEKAVPSYP